MVVGSVDSAHSSGPTGAIPAQSPIPSPYRGRGDTQTPAPSYCDSLLSTIAASFRSFFSWVSSFFAASESRAPSSCPTAAPSPPPEQPPALDQATRDRLDQLLQERQSILEQCRCLQCEQWTEDSLQYMMTKIRDWSIYSRLQLQIVRARSQSPRARDLTQNVQVSPELFHQSLGRLLFEEVERIFTSDASDIDKLTVLEEDMRECFNKHNPKLDQELIDSGNNISELIRKKWQEIQQAHQKKEEFDRKVTLLGTFSSRKSELEKWQALQAIFRDYFTDQNYVKDGLNQFKQHNQALFDTLILQIIEDDVIEEHAKKEQRYGHPIHDSLWKKGCLWMEDLSNIFEDTVWDTKVMQAKRDYLLDNIGAHHEQLLSGVSSLINRL